MRLQYAREVTRTLRALGEAGAGVRSAVKALQRDPYPAGAFAFPGRAGYYELFVDGYWIGYWVDQSDPGETVVTIVLVEAI